MPPHLHPRSRSTTSLFAVTLLASFFIVGLPHIFPCPAPRNAYADSQMAMTPDGKIQRVRRRRRKVKDETEQQGSTTAALEPQLDKTTTGLADEVAEFRRMEEESKQLEKLSRECPVPKPRGAIGSLLGFDRNQPGKGRDGAPRPDSPGRGAN